MINKKYKTLVMLFAFMIALTLLLIYIKPVVLAHASISEEKCSSFQGVQSDDCWHSLAHQTLNSKFCDNINDNETREHCFEHIPK